MVEFNAKKVRETISLLFKMSDEEIQGEKGEKALEYLDNFGDREDFENDLYNGGVTEYDICNYFHVVTEGQLTKELEEKTDKEESCGTWYAVKHWNDFDDGNGSNDPSEAAKMALDDNADYIALIYDNGSDDTYDTVPLYDINTRL